MNTKILLLSLGVVAFSSCSTAYKSGQTPDDVYFSPAREKAEVYVDVEDRQDNYRSYNNNNNVDYYNNYRDERFLRLSIGNRYRWSNFDSYAMLDNYGRYNYSIYSPWNNYYYWNNFYNPYSRFSFYYPGYYNPGFYGGGNVYIPKAPSTNATPRLFNANSYGNRTYSNRNLAMDRNLSDASRNSAHPGTSNTNNRARNNNNSYRYNNSNNNTRIYSNDSYNSPSRSSQGVQSSPAPSRTYTPSSSGSSGSSGGGVSRPSRGN